MDSVSSEAAIDTKLRRWDLFRSIMAVVAPCYPPLFSACKPEAAFTVTGTIICSTNSKVRLCIQEDADSFPLIILDLPITTSELAGLMHYGTARIVLQCDRDLDGSNEPLLSAAMWAMHCNGQKMGYAERREVTGKDKLLLEKMRTISTGAGILPGKDCGMGQCKYLRCQFERVVASNYSEAYYLIDPSDCSGQELSIFFQGIQQSHSEIEYLSSKSNQNGRYFNFAKHMEPFRYI